MTAAFAATQLLPVIQRATQHCMDGISGQQASLGVCSELLVSTNLGSMLAAAGMMLPTAKYAPDASGRPPLQNLGKRSTVLCCCADHVLIPGDQLSMACAARASQSAHAGSSHGAHASLWRSAPLPSQVACKNRLLLCALRLRSQTCVAFPDPLLPSKALTGQHWVFGWLLTHLVPLADTSNAAGHARRSGPKELSLTQMVDVACIHGAACDVAIADDKAFRTIVSEGTDMMGKLVNLYTYTYRARVHDPWSAGVLLLMNLQFARFMAAGTAVRISPCSEAGLPSVVHADS